MDSGEQNQNKTIDTTSYVARSEKISLIGEECTLMDDDFEMVQYECELEDIEYDNDVEDIVMKDAKEDEFEIEENKMKSKKSELASKKDSKNQDCEINTKQDVHELKEDELRFKRDEYEFIEDKLKVKNNWNDKKENPCVKAQNDILNNIRLKHDVNVKLEDNLILVNQKQDDVIGDVNKKCEDVNINQDFDNIKQLVINTNQEVTPTKQLALNIKKDIHNTTQPVTNKIHDVDNTNQEVTPMKQMSTNVKKVVSNPDLKLKQDILHTIQDISQNNPKISQYESKEPQDKHKGATDKKIKVAQDRLKENVNIPQVKIQNKIIKNLELIESTTKSKLENKIKTEKNVSKSIKDGLETSEVILKTETESDSFTEQVTATKRRSELNLLLQLSKEANLNTNLSRKRKSIEPRTPESTKEQPSESGDFSKRLRKVKYHERVLENRSGLKEAAEGRRKRENLTYSDVSNANNEDVDKKIWKPLKAISKMIKVKFYFVYLGYSFYYILLSIFFY